MGSFALALRLWLLHWHLAVGIVRRVVALVFLLQMKMPVDLEIATDPQRPQTEHGFGALQSPACASYFHPVFDQVATGAFDDPRGNGETRGQIGVVMQEVRILQQIVRALVYRGALLLREATQRRTASHPRRHVLAAPAQPLL